VGAKAEVFEVMDSLARLWRRRPYGQLEMAELLQVTEPHPGDRKDGLCGELPKGRRKRKSCDRATG